MTEKNSTDDELVQHFTVWKCFSRKVYQSTLTSEHLMYGGVERFVDSVFEVTKNNKLYEVKEGKLVNQKCVFLEKSGVRYVLPTRYQKYLPINVKRQFECYLKRSDKTIYKFIEKPTSVKITPEKTLSLKDLCHVFNPLQHTDPKVWTFLKIQAIGSKAKGGKYRLCSPPETGKNANDIILHSIMNDNVRVSKPTIAKLETLFYYNQKVLPDEMTSLTSSQVREVEPFFLTISDESPIFQKHSMAQKKDMNEVDITKSSCVFTYNNRDSLHFDGTFFDEIWQNRDAFDSRFPAIFLDGKITSTLPKLSMKQSQEIMEENFDKLRTIAKNIVYYIENMQKELKGYDRSKLKMKGRHKVNFECVIDALEVYSDSQEEFDEWLEFVNTSVTNYRRKNKIAENLELYSD